MTRSPSPKKCRQHVDVQEARLRVWFERQLSKAMSAGVDGGQLGGVDAVLVACVLHARRVPPEEAAHRAGRIAESTSDAWSVCWTGIVEDAMRLLQGNPHLGVDDALTVSATALLVRFARCHGIRVNV